MDDTAFHFMLTIPQAVVERTLEGQLGKRGLLVERGVDFVDCHAHPDHVAATLRHPDGREELGEARYLAGCDGADSTVRQRVGVGFTNRTYRAPVWLADLDVEPSLPPDAVHGLVGPAGMLFLFPAARPAPWRLLAIPPPPMGSPSPTGPPSREALQAVADAATGGAVRLGEPVWAVEQRLRRGQADRYRAGRVLLVGDAAHGPQPRRRAGHEHGDKGRGQPRLEARPDRARPRASGAARHVRG